MLVIVYQSEARRNPAFRKSPLSLETQLPLYYAVACENRYEVSLSRSGVLCVEFAFDAGLLSLFEHVVHERCSLTKLR